MFPRADSAEYHGSSFRVCSFRDCLNGEDDFSLFWFRWSPFCMGNMSHTNVGKRGVEQKNKRAFVSTVISCLFSFVFYNVLRKKILFQAELAPKWIQVTMENYYPFPALLLLAISIPRFLPYYLR